MQTCVLEKPALNYNVFVSLQYVMALKITNKPVFSKIKYVVRSMVFDMVTDPVALTNLSQKVYVCNLMGIGIISVFRLFNYD